MNFFEAQDKARRNTFRLVVLFALAVIALIGLTNLFLLGIYRYMQTSEIVVSPETLYRIYPLETFVAVGIGVVLLISGGSFYKMLSLAGGGPSVAEMLGGRLVSRATTDPLQRRLLNVVEEMALAAGMPIPQVYLLSDHSINAFAAGRTPADAVIGITDGALGRLGREELQGVVAHEFSHIANGDMRLNIRLISILHGILLIGLIGYFLLRSLRFAGRSRSRKGGGGLLAIAALGGGLMVIGYAGTFCGQWIKAIVSRQREYLADSSAVQFTRSIDGIGGALKKIGGSAGVGSYLDSPSAPQYSHAYFADGIASFWQSMFATHPPLEDRIRRIDPAWDGEFLRSEIQQPAEPEVERQPKTVGREAAIAAAVLSSAQQAIGEVGTLNEQNIDYVRELIVAMPAALREAAQDAYSARALIYAGLVKIQKDERAAVESLAATLANPEMQALVEKFGPQLERLEERFKLPLLELCVHSLREMSPNQYIPFKTAVQNIIASDRKINLREWVVQRFVIQQLDLHFGFRSAPRAKYGSLQTVRADVEIILSVIALAEHREQGDIEAAFAAGAAETGLKLEPVQPAAIELDRLDSALDELTRLKPLAKPRLLKACVAIIMYDGRTTPRGIELVRAISTCIDCPMPPMRP
ncbi:MAG: M48 family metallopeptidase [Gammaproteobacteria bacterium]